VVVGQFAELGGFSVHFLSSAAYSSSVKSGIIPPTLSRVIYKVILIIA